MRDQKHSSSASSFVACGPELYQSVGAALDFAALHTGATFLRVLGVDYVHVKTAEIGDLYLHEHVHMDSACSDVARYRLSGERDDWKLSMPISSVVRSFHPGYVKRGGTW